MSQLDQILLEIENEMLRQSSPEATAATRKFVPFSQNIYGLRMPDINQLAGSYKSHGLELASVLWQKGAYEERMLAAKILERSPLSEAEKILNLVDSFKNGISNWAICDALGMQAIKKSFRKVPEKTYDMALKYLEADSYWTIRLGLVYLTHFVRKGQRLREIRMLTDPLAKHEEYYVRKAVVWVKSMLAKFD